MRFSRQAGQITLFFWINKLKQKKKKTINREKPISHSEHDFKKQNCFTGSLESLIAVSLSCPPLFSFFLFKKKKNTLNDGHQFFFYVVSSHLDNKRWPLAAQASRPVGLSAFSSSYSGVIFGCKCVRHLLGPSSSWRSLENKVVINTGGNLPGEKCLKLLQRLVGIGVDSLGGPGPSVCPCPFVCVCGEWGGGCYSYSVTVQ